MKVLVAMSGGVDSAVSAFLLKKAGYDVVGIHFKMEDDLFFSKYDLKKKVCCSPDDTMDALKISKKIGIPLDVVDLKKEFRERIIQAFLDGYKAGITPNPCAWCNKKMKFWALEVFGDKMGSDRWATGHYAIVKAGKVFMANEIKKDQSYFLSLVEKKLFDRLILPVGEMQKADVRQIAIKNDLIVGAKPDSQDVCFIPDGDLGNFFRSNGVDLRAGPVMDVDGKVIGQHEGYQMYAVGQRKGIGIATGEKVYVVDVDPLKNTIKVGKKSDLFKNHSYVKDLNLFVDKSYLLDCECKVRSTSPLVKCSFDPETAIVHFYEPVVPVPGQIIAFYKDKELLGGGVLAKTDILNSL
ncbi:MAG: tRNA 2-thiouridine(34) synthase MnmA [Athalassotoga sp.]|uniref:tRNA 2-thiouridine(34) synthase MnmA n=1 Tax=Athalassotoga sp. TaxID=2022597 RepID=UPI003D062C27